MEEILRSGRTEPELGASRKRVACRALNRLIASCKEDTLALEAAAAIVRDPGLAGRLHGQAERRAFFVHDLDRAIAALGGVARRHATLTARLVDRARLFGALVGGAHEGDAYHACAAAEARTAATYAAVLDEELPGDARFGIEVHLDEIVADRDELRHLWALH